MISTSMHAMLKRQRYTMVIRYLLLLFKVFQPLNFMLKGQYYALYEYGNNGDNVQQNIHSHVAHSACCKTHSALDPPLLTVICCE